VEVIFLAKDVKVLLHFDGKFVLELLQFPLEFLSFLLMFLSEQIPLLLCVFLHEPINSVLLPYFQLAELLPEI
jgi:riboflavin transporter FmnP